MASLRPRVNRSDLPREQTFWGMTLQTKLVIVLASLWIFVFPLVDIVAQPSARSLTLLGVGSILAALACVANLVEKILRRQEAESNSVPDQFQLPEGMPPRHNAGDHP